MKFAPSNLSSRKQYRHSKTQSLTEGSPPRSLISFRLWQARKNYPCRNLSRKRFGKGDSSLRALRPRKMCLPLGMTRKGYAYVCINIANRQRLCSLKMSSRKQYHTPKTQSLTEGSPTRSLIPFRLWQVEARSLSLPKLKPKAVRKRRFLDERFRPRTMCLPLGMTRFVCSSCAA